MYSHIVLPTDGSPLSEHAIDQGVAFAKAVGARVTIVTIVEPFYVFSASPEHIGQTHDNYEKHAKQTAQRILETAESKAKAAGVPAEVKLVGSEHPDQAIIDIANERGADLIAMSSHGRRGVSALLLGSVTQKVLTHSDVPVLVFRKKK